MKTESHDLKKFPTHEYDLVIREHHLDTFGHMNNAQYLILCEEARWEMITSRGYGLKEVHQSKVGTVVLECTVRFKREIKLREKIKILTRVGSLSRKILILNHRFLKENGDIAAEASFTMGCFHLGERKLVPPTPEWLAAISGLKK